MARKIPDGSYIIKASFKNGKLDGLYVTKWYRGKPHPRMTHIKCDELKDASITASKEIERRLKQEV